MKILKVYFCLFSLKFVILIPLQPLNYTMLYIRFIKRLLLILIVCLFALNIQAMRFRHLSIPEGLSQLSVLSIYQDRLGRMWFGTEEGVNIFDGKTVTAIKKFRGMNPHNIEVRRICGDDNGNVYFSSRPFGSSHRLSYPRQQGDCPRRRVGSCVSCGPSLLCL